MNWKSTAALLAIAVALLAYFKFYEDKQPGPLPPGHDHPLVVMERGQIDNLTIMNHDLKIALHREDSGEWVMKSPIADRADVALIGEVLNNLESGQIESTIPAGDFVSKRSNLQDFGLQAPRLRLQITARGGQPGSELIFGNDTPIASKTYLQVAGRNDVYVVGSELKKALDKDVNAWRDHRLTEMAATDVTKLTVKNAAGELELQRMGEHWQITKPLNARANDQKVNDLASQLTNMTVASFVADDKADAATYGLADPRGMVTLYTGKDTKGTELIIGSAKTSAPADKNDPVASALPAGLSADGTIYLRMPSRQSIYTVAKGVEDFLNLKPNDVRDRSLVRLNADMVDRIKISPAGGTGFTLARKDKDWKVLAPPADEPANASEADKLMQDLSQATVATFVADTASDLAKYGLDKPQLKVAFSSFASENTAESAAGEKPVATVSFGKVEDPNVFVRVEEEPFVLSVPRSVMDSVPAERTQWQPLNIFQTEAEKIASISVVAEGHPELALTRVDKAAWTLSKGTGPLDESKAQSVANTLARLHAVRWVSANLPGDVGLEPVAFATIRFETPGNPKGSGVLKLGHTGPENMGYARVDGKPGTFLISRPDYDTLLQSLVPEATPTPTPTPVATPTPEPSATPVVTMTPAPTATPEATPTLTPAPTPTPTPEPTAIPAPVPAPTATPVPEPTATPVPPVPPTPVPTPSPTATPTPIATPAPAAPEPPAAPVATPAPAPTTAPTPPATEPASPPVLAPPAETPATTPNLPPA